MECVLQAAWTLLQRPQRFRMSTRVCPSSGVDFTAEGGTYSVAPVQSLQRDHSATSLPSRRVHEPDAPADNAPNSKCSMAIPQSRRLEITGVSPPSKKRRTVAAGASGPAGPGENAKRQGWRFVAEGAVRAASTPARTHPGQELKPGAMVSSGFLVRAFANLAVTRSPEETRSEE